MPISLAACLIVLAIAVVVIAGLVYMYFYKGWAMLGKILLKLVAGLRRFILIVCDFLCEFAVWDNVRPDKTKRK